MSYKTTLVQIKLNMQRQLLDTGQPY